MCPGESSEICRAVIEEFARHFLLEPAVLLLSESRSKLISVDEDLLKSIDLEIEVDRHLPDIILIDLAPQDILLIFVEAVATDGPISASRKKAFLSKAMQAGFKKEQVVFVSAFIDRAGATYRKVASVLAWGTFAWFASEPLHILILKEGSEETGVKRLSELI